jgi:AAA domain
MPRPTVDIEKVAARVEKKIKRASEFDPNQNMLIYGYPDSGKTRLAATAPKCLIIDVDEKGTDSVRRDIDPYVYRIEFWNEVNDLYWYAQSGNHDFQSFAIDGLTGLQTLCMNFVLGDEAARDASRDPDMPSRQVYGKVSQLMRTQITNWRNLPYNTIFTALPRTRDTGDGEEEEILITGPSLSPAIAAHATAAVGTIGYLTKREVILKSKKVENGEEKITKRKEVRRRLILGPQAKYITKDRNGQFGEYLDAPNLAEMLTVIQSKEA